jgi:hypothetical protein
MKELMRFLRRHWLASVLVLGLILLVVSAIRSVLLSPQDPRLTAIRQAGYPVTFSELNAYYPTVPDNQNAALVYERAFQTELFTHKVAEDLTSNVVIRRGEPLPEKYRAELAEALAQHAAAYQLLYSATNLSGSRYPIDLSGGFMVTLPHLAQVKRAALLLSLEGLSHASVGESTQAYAAFDAALHVADSLRQEPVLVSFLVQIAATTVVAERLEETLNLVSFSDEQLRSLQERFAAPRDQGSPARAFAAERAMGLSFFLDRQMQRSLGQPNQILGGFPSGFPGEVVLAVYRASGLMRKDEDFYLETMNRSVALAELPAEERIRKGPPPSMAITNRYLLFSRVLLPALQRVIGRADEFCARMRVVETGLGVERFRLAHSGALPDRLADLASGFLQAVPLDPYDSQPLRYKKLARGYVVYSIGPDQNDDGGAAPPPSDNSQARSTSTPTDITFVVERN